MPERVSDIMYKVIRDSGIVNENSDINISAIDQESLTELIGKEFAPKAFATTAVPEKNSAQEAFENAIIFIGTMFAEELLEISAGGNSGKFAIRLALNLHDEKVKNSVEIIATYKGKVQKKILSKYKITNRALDTIYYAYNSYYHLFH